MSTNHQLYVGIDGGGTKTELLAKRPAGRRTIQHLGGGSNLQLQGLEGSVSVLTDLIELARESSGSDEIGFLCLGLSGAGRPHEQADVADALARRLSLDRSRVKVVSDAEIAVEAAFEGESGVLVIAGTGSMACGRSIAGSFVCTGGWGRLLGDEGSGYAIGRAGLQAVAAALDGGPRTELLDRARDLFGEASKAVLVEQVYREEWPLQEFAPHVLEAVERGDDEAKRILEDQTAKLARRVQWLTQNKTDTFERQLALIGGLSNAPIFREVFERALNDLGTDWRIERSIARPAVGALRMALATA